jgi:chromosome segregation ATPase
MQRTPPTGSGLASGLSDSYQNLSKTLDISDASQITFRSKRKFENNDYELMSEVAEMRKQMSEMQKQMREMMTYLATTNSTQVESYQKIREDLSDVKNQVNKINSTTKFLIKEQLEIKDDIENLKKQNSNAEKKIEA